MLIATSTHSSPTATQTPLPARLLQAPLFLGFDRLIHSVLHFRFHDHAHFRRRSARVQEAPSTKLIGMYNAKTRTTVGSSEGYQALIVNCMQLGTR